MAPKGSIVTQKNVVDKTLVLNLWPRTVINLNTSLKSHKVLKVFVFSSENHSIYPYDSKISYKVYIIKSILIKIYTLIKSIEANNKFHNISIFSYDKNKINFKQVGCQNCRFLTIIRP